MKDRLEKEGIVVEDISYYCLDLTKIKKYGNNNIPIFQILKKIDTLENILKKILRQKIGFVT